MYYKTEITHIGLLKSCFIKMSVSKNLDFDSLAIDRWDDVERLFPRMAHQAVVDACGGGLLEENSRSIKGKEPGRINFGRLSSRT